MSERNFVSKHISIRGAQLYFRNFSGKKGEYNLNGLRTFGIFLEPELADELRNDGWNVRMTKPNQRDPDAPIRPWLKVEVSYRKRPPIAVLKKGKNKTNLDESDIKMLDWVDISNVDVIINPYNWEVNGKHGVKGFLKAIYVTAVEDEFAAEYADVPNSDSLEDGV